MLPFDQLPVNHPSHLFHPFHHGQQDAELTLDLIEVVPGD
jgi:hypothetical protein